MVSPVRRREAVEVVEARLEVSQRRACSTLGQHRSTQRYRPRRGESDAPLLAAIRRWAGAEPRWGYRMVAGKLREEGWAVNFKRVHRLLSELGNTALAKTYKSTSDSTSAMFFACAPPTAIPYSPHTNCRSTGRSASTATIASLFNISSRLPNKQLSQSAWPPDPGCYPTP